MAARWLFESQLFKQLQYIVDDGHGHTCAPISNHAVARYLSLQFELVESVFMPINDLIVQCIHISNNISGSIVASATLKLCTHAATLEYLRRTFAIEKAHYWLGMLVKLKKLLYEATSPYYQVRTYALAGHPNNSTTRAQLISAADATEIRALAAPWKSVVERIKSRHGTNRKRAVPPFATHYIRRRSCAGAAAVDDAGVVHLGLEDGTHHLRAART